jgi:hypothetical protein
VDSRLKSAGFALAKVHLPGFDAHSLLQENFAPPGCGKFKYDRLAMGHNEF